MHESHSPRGSAKVHMVFNWQQLLHLPSVFTPSDHNPVWPKTCQFCLDRAVISVLGSRACAGNIPEIFSFSFFNAEVECTWKGLMEHGPFFFNESSLYTCGKQQSKTGTLVARVKNALETRRHSSQLWECVAWREWQQSRTDHTWQLDSPSSDSNFVGSLTMKWGFPGGSDSKVYACNSRDLGLIPGLGRFLGEGNGNPLQYSCLENGGAWQATVHETTEVDMTERLTFHFHWPWNKSRNLPMSQFICKMSVILFWTVAVRIGNRYRSTQNSHMLRAMMIAIKIKTFSGNDE